MKVYEAIAAALAGEGVETVFGLMGDGNMSLWSHLAREGRIELVSSAHEQGAVAMADGYARTAATVGVATVTHGPGLTQTATSLAIAARSRTPLVLLAGQVRRGALHASQRMEQRPFAEACGARFVELTSAENLAEEVAGAFHTARVHRIPVVLNLDVELQESHFDWAFSYTPSTRHLRQAPRAVDAGSIARLCDLLQASERPVLLAGRGAMASGAREDIVALGEQVGALLATSLPAKGMFQGEAWDIGISGTFSSEPTERLLGEADLIVAVGAEVGYYTSEGGLMFPMAEIVRIDCAPVPQERGLLPGEYFSGDARLTVAAVRDELRRRGFSQAGFRNDETRDVLQAAPASFATPKDGIDPRALATALGAALPGNAQLTCGCGHFWAFPAMYMPMRPDVHLQFSYEFGAIGQTLPLAIGIGRASADRPQVVIDGDGSLLMNIQEMFTACRYRMNMVLLVWNDGGFGAEVHKLSAKGADLSIARWSNADFISVARAFGGDGVRIDSVAQLAPAISRGVQQGGLFVIDMPVSPNTISDPYAKLFHGVPSQAPLLRPPAH